MNVLSEFGAGIYRLTVEAQGFEKKVTEDIKLEVAGKVTRDVVLSVGNTNQSVTVDGSGVNINTVDANVSAVVDRQFVENMPLNGRSFQSLMTMVPGFRWFPLKVWARAARELGLEYSAVSKLWQYDQLSTMVAPYKGKPPLTNLGSVDRAVAVARQTMPDMTPAFVAFPETIFSSPHHYAVFMRGKTPLTSRLYRPALIDAQTGQLTDSRTMPWYVTALLISQPLHFGDYGGLPLKIIWALLDIVTIVVLITGLYLWLSRRKTPVEERLDELVELETAKTVEFAR